VQLCRDPPPVHPAYHYPVVLRSFPARTRQPRPRPTGPAPPHIDHTATRPVCFLFRRGPQLGIWRSGFIAHRAVARPSTGTRRTINRYVPALLFPPPKARQRRVHCDLVPVILHRSGQPHRAFFFSLGFGFALRCTPLTPPTCITTDNVRFHLRLWFVEFFDKCTNNNYPQ